MKNLCPFCEEGQMRIQSYTDHVQAGRHSLTIHGLKKLVCPICEGDYVDPDQYAANAKLITDAMAATPAAVSRGLLRTLRETWGLTQREASRVFGAGDSSFAKWESGQANMSDPAALLVQCAYKFPEVMRHLAKLASVAVQPQLPDSPAWKEINLEDGQPSSTPKVYLIANRRGGFPNKRKAVPSTSFPSVDSTETEWMEAA